MLVISNKKMRTLKSEIILNLEFDIWNLFFIFFLFGYLDIWIFGIWNSFEFQ